MPTPPDEFIELFAAIYLRFCRRRDKSERRLTLQMSGVLQHLAMSGPLTVGEMSQHFSRAQSVVSEIVDGLERKGLLARIRDSRDRRRTLIWLTDEAHDVMRRDRQVLDQARVGRAMAVLGDARSGKLVAEIRAFLAAGDGVTTAREEKQS